MIYYSAHCGGNINRVKYCKENGIRVMVTAGDYRKPYTEFALDNGAWRDYLKGEPFNHERFKKVLSMVKNSNLTPDFVVLPDIVGGGRNSLNLSRQYLWLTEMYNCYLSVQDGMCPEMIGNEFLENIAGIFVGGTTVWKWRNVHIWVAFAHQHGLKCHVGRVNTLKHFNDCVSLGVDTADGSTLIRHDQMERISEYMKISHNIQKRLA